MAFIVGPVPEQFVREVATTPAAFQRDLHKAWPAGVVADQVSAEGGVFHLTDGGLSLEIQIEAAGVRCIGLLSLPLCRATYRVSGGDEAARARLLATLDRAMQRGGG